MDTPPITINSKILMCVFISLIVYIVKIGGLADISKGFSIYFWTGWPNVLIINKLFYNSLIIKGLLL